MWIKLPNYKKAEAERTATVKESGLMRKTWKRCALALVLALLLSIALAGCGSSGGGSGTSGGGMSSGGGGSYNPPVSPSKPDGQTGQIGETGETTGETDETNELTWVRQQDESGADASEATAWTDDNGYTVLVRYMDEDGNSIADPQTPLTTGKAFEWVVYTDSDMEVVQEVGTTTYYSTKAVDDDENGLPDKAAEILTKLEWDEDTVPVNAYYTYKEDKEDNTPITLTYTVYDTETATENGFSVAVTENEDQTITIKSDEVTIIANGSDDAAADEESAATESAVEQVLKAITGKVADAENKALATIVTDTLKDDANLQSTIAFKTSEQIESSKQAATAVEEEKRQETETPNPETPDTEEPETPDPETPDTEEPETPSEDTDTSKHWYDGFEYEGVASLVFASGDGEEADATHPTSATLTVSGTLLAQLTQQRIKEDTAATATFSYDENKKLIGFDCALPEVLGQFMEGAPAGIKATRTGEPTTENGKTVLSFTAYAYADADTSLSGNLNIEITLADETLESVKLTSDSSTGVVTLTRTAGENETVTYDIEYIKVQTEITTTGSLCVTVKENRPQTLELNTNETMAATHSDNIYDSETETVKEATGNYTYIDTEKYSIEFGYDGQNRLEKIELTQASECSRSCTLPAHASWGENETETSSQTCNVTLTYDDNNMLKNVSMEAVSGGNSTTQIVTANAAITYAADGDSTVEASYTEAYQAGSRKVVKENATLTASYNSQQGLQNLEFSQKDASDSARDITISSTGTTIEDQTRLYLNGGKECLLKTTVTGDGNVQYFVSEITEDDEDVKVWKEVTESTPVVYTMAPEVEGVLRTMANGDMDFVYNDGLSSSSVERADWYNGATTLENCYYVTANGSSYFFVLPDDTASTSTEDLYGIAKLGEKTSVTDSEDSNITAQQNITLVSQAKLYVETDEKGILQIYSMSNNAKVRQGLTSELLSIPAISETVAKVVYTAYPLLSAILTGAVA
jgi:hypothetical protein